MTLSKTGTKTAMVPWTARRIEGTTQKILSGAVVMRTGGLMDARKRSMSPLRRTRRLAALNLLHPSLTLLPYTKLPITYNVEYFLSSSGCEGTSMFVEL